MLLDIQICAVIGYIFFGMVMGFRLIPMAKTKTERILTLLVSGPVIWVLFSFFYVREITRIMKGEEE